MSTMQLYSVKPALLGTARSLGVRLNQRLDLFHRQLSGHLPNDGIREGRWGHGLLTSKAERKCLAPGMMKLDSNLGPSGMDPVHKPP